ncbi:long-chain fatty acid--CoA ligase [Phytomonospora sp. NPDC050363]|uniref:long-chain-fatty-acid--CoA ligase n=1 Tax=Phytomonospora sp. NPDC050363 TaxID=3155642 RepID=UPI0033F3A5F6
MATLSLASILAESALRRPGHTAVIEGERRLSYAELWLQARGQAAALAALGVRPGDRVALMAPNTVEFPRAYYAILAAGAVVVPIHLLMGPEETAHVLRDSGAKLLLCHAAVLAGGAQAAIAARVRLMAIGPPASAPGVDGRLEDLAETTPPPSTHVSRAPDDPAVVFYTSGTTGVPKGAVLTHLNLVMNATVNAFDCHDVRRCDVALGALPLFHTYGQSVSMNATFRLGATMVLLPRFQAAEAIALMIKEGVTIFHGVPTMFHALSAAAEDASELPRLRLCISGGASLPGPVLERFEKSFGTEVYEGYGLSETSPTATVNQPVFGRRVGTVGHPVWGVDVEIARADLEEEIELLAAGELGEIVIRGHNVFAGYLDLAEATASSLVDGWFRTGDLGTRDADGFVAVVDRKKDMVIRGGFNVYPREVEDVLLRHPEIAEVAVIGLPHPVHGEEICAVVVPAGEEREAETLVEWARDRLGPLRYPRRVEFVDELPLGPSLKVLKRELRARYSG